MMNAVESTERGLYKFFGNFKNVSPLNKVWERLP